MSWNYRVVRRTYLGVELYGIRAAFDGFYEDRRPAFTEEVVEVEGESVDELREMLRRMIEALEKPVLDYDTREEIT